MSGRDLAKQPLKTLRLIARLNVGGPARHVILLDQGLQARGYSTLLIHGSVDSSEASLEHLALERSVPTLKISDLGRRLSPLSDLRVLVRLVALMFRERPDVLHTHTAKAGTLGRLAALAYNVAHRRRHRCLVIHTFHGHVLTGYFGRFGSTTARWIERALAGVTDWIVTISARQQRDIADRFGIASSRKVVVIPLGLELEPLLALAGQRPEAKSRFGFNADDVVFGYMGRFVPIKDLDTLLRAFALVAQSMDHVRLLMVGDGELRPHLEALAATLGVGATVCFAGWRLDLACVYSAVDAIVLSSLNEGTPVALIEAMAAGLPVVVTAVGGVPDLVDDGRTGILVPPRQPEQMARAMLTLAKDPSLRVRMGAAGRLQVQHRFTAERLVSDVAGLYLDGLRHKRGTG